MLRTSRDEVAALHALWRARRRGRLGNLEWFDVAYRAYLVALVGGGGTWWLIGLVPDDPVSEAGLGDVTTYGPALLASLIAVSMVVGLRSGLSGGPVALEPAEIHHVLTAAVPRSAVLRRHLLQRFSTVIARSAFAGAVAGILASERLPGSTRSWMLRSIGVAIATAMVTTALATLVHARRWSRPRVNLLAAVLMIWQVLSIPDLAAGPLDVIGRIALDELSPDPVPGAVIGFVTAGVIGLAVGAWAMVGGLSPERLERRSSLVAQLRFALAVGDLRTVTLLRRQLVGDHTRVAGWPLPGSTLRSGTPYRLVRRRCLRGWSRIPPGRLARVVVAAGATGAASAGAVTGTTPLILIAALGAFVIGFDVTEALAEHLDHPDLTQMVPVDAGRLAAAHLPVPAVLVGLLAVPGVIGALVVAPHAMTIAVAAIAGIPAFIAAAGGSVVATIKGAPDPLATIERVVSLPPEVAGFATTARILWPPVVSVLGATPLLFVAAAIDNDDQILAAAFRSAVGSCLIAGAIALWVRHRDDLRRRWRTLVERGDQARRQSWEDRHQREGTQP